MEAELEMTDELVKDWFDRDGKTYVKIRNSGRIGWEDTLKEGSAYSSYILESPSLEELVKRAYTMANEMIIAMNLPFKTTIKITNIESGATDGARIYLGTSMFDTSMDNGEKLDTFLGTVVHEGCHLLYTDFDAIGGISDRFTESESRVIRIIANILEDERIETLLGEHKPGFARFIEKAKYYYFDYYKRRVKKKTMSDFDRVMDCFLSIIRYPKYVSKKDVTEFYDSFLEVKKMLTPFPDTTSEVVSKSKEIFDVFKKYLYEGRSSEKGGKEERKEDKISSGGSESSDSDNGSDKKDNVSDESLDKSEDSGKDTTGDKPSGSESIDVMEKTFGMKSSKSEDTFDKAVLKNSDISAEVSKQGYLLGQLCEGIVETGSDRSVLFRKAASNKHLYDGALRKVKRYIPAISRTLKGHCKDYKLVHRSMRSGVIDTNKLAEAVQGVPTVYVRGGMVKTDKVSLCVLVDQSGSMALGDRIVSAREMAVLLNESVGHIPDVELFIYGHSADLEGDYYTDLFVYREKNYAPKYSLGTICPKEENRDGTAIYEVAKRVRKQTDNEVLFFILSDGAPCAFCYHGEMAFNHVKASVEEVEKMGFNVVQICIDPCYDPSVMFKHFIVVKDLGKLAFEIGKVIKKAIINKAKTHIYGI